MRQMISSIVWWASIAGILGSSVLGYALWCNRAVERQSWSGQAIGAALRSGIWALLMPIIILGGIYSGLFTPTESAAVAVVYALVVETCIYRDLRVHELGQVVLKTGVLLGSLFPVLMMAFALNMYLTYQQVPEHMVAWLGERVTNPAVMLIGTNLFLLLIGCLMDIGSAILVLAPMLAPLAADQGVSLLHFGVIMVVNLEIGYLTPPLGLNLIVAMSVFREDFWTICRGVLPFVVLMLLALLLISFYPALSLGLLD